MLGQLGLLLLFTPWAFGGQAPWARQIIAWWGTLGIFLFIWGSCVCHPQPNRLHPAIRLLWPLWLYDLLVLISCLNPGFREVSDGAQSTLVMITPTSWLPSAALPRLAAKELWQCNGLILSSFNLLYVLHRRRHVRALLFFLAGNAVVLAIFGTFQKLIGAKGLWFGLVPSPNVRFFSTFIYHNHWGAFILLNTAVCLGLLFHYHRRGHHRDLLHSPVLLGAVVTLLLAATIPLSASRSCTVLVGLLLGYALLHFLVQLRRLRHAAGTTSLAPVAGVTVLVMLALLAVIYLGRNSIAERLRQTSAQVSQIGEGQVVTSRLTLYHDTWQMTAAKPWFGWGLESYAHVFRIFNTQRATETWVWIPFYAEAHNDWLQSLAEVGFIGTGLLGLLLLLPLLSVPWRRCHSALPRYLLAGCGLLLLYAWLEFPFANPAVLLTFGTVYWCAIRYAEIEANYHLHA